MKKIFIVLALVIAGYLGATLFTASQFERQQQILVDKINAADNTTLLESEFSSGLLGSRGRYVFQVDIDPQVSLIFTLPWQASYWPGWVTLVSQFKLEAVDDVQRQDLGQYLGLGNILLTGRADWQKASLHYQLDVLDTEVEGVQLAIKNLDFQLVYHYSGEQQSSLKFDQFELIDQQQGLVSFGDVTVNATQQGDLPWVSADWYYQAKKLRIRQDLQALELDDLNLGMTYQLQPQGLNWRAQFGLAGLQMTQAGIPLAALERANLAVKLTLKDGTQFAQAVEQLAQLDVQQLDAVQRGEAIGAQLAESILAGEPRLELEDLSFSTPEPVAMAPKAQGWAELPATNGRALDQVLGQLNLELNLQNIPAELLMIAGLPLDVLSDDDSYQVKVADGMLYLNGEPIMPL